MKQLTQIAYCTKLENCIRFEKPFNGYFICAQITFCDNSVMHSQANCRLVMIRISQVPSSGYSQAICWLIAIDRRVKNAFTLTPEIFCVAYIQIGSNSDVDDAWSRRWMRLWQKRKVCCDMLIAVRNICTIIGRQVQSQNVCRDVSWMDGTLKLKTRAPFKFIIVKSYENRL